MANPISATPSLSSIVISTSGYTLAPYANEPGCKQCVDTLDTRITGAPVYHNGLISFALETGMSNGTQVVPTIFWGQVSPVLSDTGKVSSASVWQSGYFIFSGDTTVSFGTLMPDSDGNLFMVFELMSSTLNPETAYTARRVSFTPGRFHDGGIVLKAGAAPTTNFRWGDYEATSWDGFSANTVWFAGEYAPSNRTWSTYIGRSAFTTSTP
jgi:hypothetical protein